jgi:hypothetical protein
MIAVVNAAGAHDGFVVLQMFTQAENQCQDLGGNFPTQ